MPAVNFGPSGTTPAPASVTTNPELPTPNSVLLVDGQRPAMRLRLMLKLYSYRANAAASTPVEKYLLVSLEGTTVSPGGIRHDQSDDRGYYTHSVRVQMWFPQIPDDIILLQDLPATSEEAGSESNSISLNFGGGFFGGTPTGNAGMTISNSVTETAPDFEISNMSSGTNMVHLYTLHLVEGAVYRNPTDLVNFLDFCNLRELPARAKETFPVLSQALFHAPKGLTKQAALHIEIDQLLMRITKTWYPIKPVVEYDDHTYSNAWDIPIDFGSVA